MKLIDKVQKLTLIFQDQFMNNQLSWILSFHYDQNQMTFLIEIEAAISMISTHINNYSEPRDDITLKNMNGLGRFMRKKISSWKQNDPAFCWFSADNLECLQGLSFNIKNDLRVQNWWLGQNIRAGCWSMTGWLSFPAWWCYSTCPTTDPSD